MLPTFSTVLAVEVQVHHAAILFLKETEHHILYEVIRAKGIEDLTGKLPPAPLPAKE